MELWMSMAKRWNGLSISRSLFQIPTLHLPYNYRETQEREHTNGAFEFGDDDKNWNDNGAIE